MTNIIKESYDVVIVGAGVGGGAMANRLAQAGASVLVIERGNYLPREADNWSVKAVFHDKKYTAKETWRDREGQPFNPSTYYYVGGNSKFFGAATVRFRAQDFEALEHEAGVAPAWPIRYAELAPYYDIAERLMGTHGLAGADPIEPPRSGPMPHPPIGHEPVIEAIAEKLRAKGLRPFPLPIAIDRHDGGNCAAPHGCTSGRPRLLGNRSSRKKCSCARQPTPRMPVRSLTGMTASTDTCAVCPAHSTPGLTVPVVPPPPRSSGVSSASSTQL